MHGPTLIAKYGTNVQAVWSHCFSYTNPTSQSLSLSHTHFVSLLLLSHSLCLSYFVLNALYHLFFNFGHLNTNSNPIPLFSLSLSLSLSLTHTHTLSSSCTFSFRRFFTASNFPIASHNCVVVVVVVALLLYA